MDRPGAPLPTRPTWQEVEHELTKLVALTGAERAEVILGPVTLSVYRDETDLTSPISKMALTLPRYGHYRAAAEALRNVLAGLFPPPSSAPSASPREDPRK